MLTPISNTRASCCPIVKTKQKTEEETDKGPGVDQGLRVEGEARTWVMELGLSVRGHQLKGDGRTGRTRCWVGWGCV